MSTHVGKNVRNQVQYVRRKTKKKEKRYIEKKLINSFVRDSTSE